MITDGLTYLYTLERLGMKFGLENISRLCAALGHPERTFDSVIVAGTNGKGSVTAMVHRGLVAAGHRAARYTSPHLERIEERFVIGDSEVKTSELESSASRIREVITRLQLSGEVDAPATFFEAATAIAFDLFTRAGVSVAVLEVGLGGRLDATNVVTPVAAAITSIDFDHEAQLGHTLESIAFEKAGVIKAGIPVVCGRLPPAAEAVIRETCARVSARYVATGSNDDLGEIPALRGTHQLDNARVAVRLLRELDALGIRVGQPAMHAAVSDVVWPGRLEHFHYHGKEVLIDAAHNPSGARALAAYLRQAGWTGCALIFGAVQDKNVAGMLGELAPVCEALICTTPDSPRSLEADTVARIARTTPGAAWDITTVTQPRDALTHAVRCYSRVAAAGSIFMIGPLRGILRNQ